MRTVLITGFEPFDGADSNASWDVARAVRAGWDAEREGAALVLGLLPVSFSRAAEPLDRAVAEHRPEVVLGLGLAAGRASVGIERVALNLADARIPDNDGAQPLDEPVEADGPPARFATMPVKAALASCRSHGLPVEASLSAGTFVCNALMYRALGIPGPELVGFVHVPQSGGEHAASAVPTLPLTVLEECVLTIARACLGHAGPDLRVVGGAVS